MIHSIPTIASTSKTTSVPEPMILRIQIMQIFMRIEPYFSFLSNQYFLCQTKYSPNIIDSPVDDAGEAVNLCVAQIKDRLAKANDVPWGYYIKIARCIMIDSQKPMTYLVTFYKRNAGYQ